MRKINIIIILITILSIIVVNTKIDIYAENDDLNKEKFEIINDTKEKNIIDENNKNTDAYVIEEIEDLRTENSTTYLMSDGSRKLEINGMKVRYRDGNKLKKYNNNFKKISVKDRNELKKIHKTDENILKNDAISRYKYVNVSGDSKQYFPEVYDKETGIIMEKEDMTISFKPLFQNNKIIHYNKMNDNIISYYDEIDNIEYKYTSLNNAVKEDIIIREKPNYNYFEFEVRLHNMMMEEDEYSKAINIIHLDTKKKIAYIEEPNIKDNNEINYDDIEYELKKLIVNTI